MADVRHELKYFIAAADAPGLMDRLGKVLRIDPNAGVHDEYTVRSLYFDDFNDSAYNDKMDGVAQRDKYRIRIYKLSDREIFLERKRKQGDLIRKDSAAITRRLAEQLIGGDPTGLHRADNPLLKDMFVQMRLRGMRPRVVVDYERVAYLHPVERVRVTFDKKVRSGLTGRDLFDPGLAMLPVLMPGRMVLEVKYDRYLPDFIAALLSSVSAERSAISKYTLCRQYAPV